MGDKGKIFDSQRTNNVKRKENCDDMPIREKVWPVYGKIHKSSGGNL